MWLQPFHTILCRVPFKTRKILACLKRLEDRCRNTDTDKKEMCMRISYLRGAIGWHSPSFQNVGIVEHRLWPDLRIWTKVRLMYTLSRGRSRAVALVGKVRTILTLSVHRARYEIKLGCRYPYRNWPHFGSDRLSCRAKRLIPQG